MRSTCHMADKSTRLQHSVAAVGVHQQCIRKMVIFSHRSRIRYLSKKNREF